MDEEKVLDISWGTIIKIAIAFFCFYIIYLIRDVLIWFVFAIIISVLFNPAIDFLQKKRIPRIFATIFIYVAFFGIFGFLIYLIAPLFVLEIQQFTQLFPQYFGKIAPPLKGLGISAFESFEVFTKSFQDWLSKASSNIFSAIASIFGGIFSTFTIFTLALFISLEENGIEKVIGLLSPKNKEAYILGLWKRCRNQVAGWFGSRILGAFFVGLLTFLACDIFNIKYAVSFGFLAGVFDIVPILGPVVSGIIIVMFSALDSFRKAIFIFIAFLLIQQIESNIIVPILTRKFIGLPAVLVLLSVIVGGRLWGFLGAILAIPIAGIIYEFLRDFLRKRKEEKAIVLE